jgi:iturin family lipopeptide synthetase A
MSEGQIENINTRQREKILSELSSIINRISGIEIIQEENPDVNFFELGLDSLMVVRIGQGIQKVFGLEMKVSQFYEEASTINNLVTYIEQHLPSDWATSSAIEPTSDISSQIVMPPGEISVPEKVVMPVISEKFDNQKYRQSASAVERIMSHQLQTMSKLMSQQLELLKNSHRSDNFVSSSTVEKITDKPKEKSEETVNQANIRSMEFKKENLTSRQAQFVKDFIVRYAQRTQKSKSFVQKTRSVFSDWINSLGFRLSLKEIKYPIVASKALGSKIWDIDGNEYIDIAIGYGVSYFGNRAPFIVKAIETQLHEGFELGPQTPLGSEVAQLIHELTGVEQVAFCNTGSEAVMFALRIARTVTKKQKIVIFSGSYHGNSDGVLVTQGENGTLPVAPGIPEGMVENVLILNYGTPETLKTIEAHAHELAAVLVEPVQSRRPGFQPKEFLQKLRELTTRAGVVLIFDEMITGFRIHPGGAQAWFGIKADLVTYGKIVGGGMPIGVVAGKAKYMSAIDGGLWNFGDESFPNQTVTFFAGTFCKHPLSMVAARAVLMHLKEQGTALQAQVNARTARFVSTLNDFFKKENVAIRVTHFGSLFRFESFGKYHQLLEPIEMILLFYLLMEKGVYAWERYICFLSTAHTDEDLEYIIQAVKESIKELRAGGFTLESDPLEVQTYPMSSAQKRLFVLNELDGEQSSYQTPKAFIVEGELNAQQVEQCFAEIINRHDSLRTTFAVQPDGDMIQQVYAHVDFNVFYQENDEENIEAIIREFIQPFDFTKAPIMRVGVVKLSTNRHLLLFDSHHIVLDGLSTNILVQEFTQLYQGKTLPPALKQYKDYGLWQQTQFETDKFVQQEAYWVTKFSDTIPVIDLPTDYPRPINRSSNGSVVYSVLSQEQTQSLKSFARQTGVTLNMLLLGIYNVWLHRLTGQEDMIVGSPVSGRPAGFEHSLGMFANTIAMRNQPKKDLLFQDFLHQVKLNAVHDYDHQDYLFENLVDKLNLPRDLSRNTLYDVMCTYERADERVFKITGLVFTPYRVDLETAKFDLVLDITEQQEELHLALIYSTDIFKPETIERWLGYFEKITQEIVKNPQQRVGEINILSSTEKQRLLVELNNTAVDYPPHKTIVDLFEAQVVKTPNKVAIVLENVSLTYQQLNQQSNQLAHYLRNTYHIQPDVKVALLLGRSEWMIVGILGVLKAGGAYVPLDTSFPKERLALLLEETQTPILLTKKHLLDKAPTSSSAHVFCLDAEWEVIAQESPDNPLCGRTPDNIVYVLYTSGSTGEPKGVMVTHQGLYNYVYWCMATCFNEVSESALVASSLAFDVSITGLFPPLLVGGTVVLFPESQDIETLAQTIQQGRYGLVKLTPSHFEAINQMLSPTDLDHRVGVLVIGGEKLKAESLSLWRNHAPSTRIINHYSPTEMVCGRYVYEIPPQVVLKGVMPLGRPIPNTQTYILNDALQLVPLGVAGELYIGGSGMSRGYLNHPDWTADRFLPNPFSTEPGARMYKSGDLVRYLPDGNIEFLDRIDDQVKIRGYRIEPKEIEGQLLRHPQINKALVLAEKNNDETLDLVAYLVSDAQLQIPELQEYLGIKLPAYMIPSLFVQIDNIPLTQNNKVDKKALRAFKATAVKPSKVNTEKPHHALETQLIGIWETVLGQKGIGVHDNFFDLGGHSIKAIRLLSRLRAEIGMDIKLRDIFLAPTIAELATRADNKSDHLLDEPIEALPSQSDYEVSNAQKRLWLIEQMTDNPVVYNIHVAYLFEGSVKV